MNVNKLNRQLRSVIGELGIEPRRVLHVHASIAAYAVPVMEYFAGYPGYDTRSATITVLRDYELIYITPQAAGVRAGYGQRSGTLVVADIEEE